MEKLASFCQLTPGIAHEIKNPLDFVNNFAALSRDRLEQMLAIDPFEQGAGLGLSLSRDIESRLSLKLRR